MDDASDDGLFHEPLPILHHPDSPAASPTAGEDGVESVVESEGSVQKAAPPGAFADCPVKAPPAAFSMGSPTSPPVEQRAKDPPPPPPPTGAQVVAQVAAEVDPWQDPSMDPWSAPPKAKPPPAHLRESASPPAQQLSHSRPPPPPKPGSAPQPQPQSEAKKPIPKPPPKSCVPPPPKPPPKNSSPPAPPPKPKATLPAWESHKDAFAHLQAHVEREVRETRMRPAPTPTPYAAPKISAMPPGPAQSSGQGQYFKDCAWVPDAMNKFILCYRMESVEGNLSQNATNIYSAVLGENSLEVVETNDNWEDSTMMGNLVGVCGWEHVLMMRLDIPDDNCSPFAGMAAVGIGSNVKIRTRAAKLALAVTVRIALQVNGMHSLQNSHVPEFEQLVAIATKRRNFDINYFEKNSPNSASLDASRDSSNPPQNFSSAYAEEFGSAAPGSRLLHKAVQGVQHQAPTYGPSSASVQASHPAPVSRPPVVGSWDVPASKPAPPPKKAPPMQAPTQIQTPQGPKDVEELLRLGIPRECIGPSYMEFRPWDTGGGLWSFCTLCSKWADASHMTSKGHLKKLAWFEEPQAATTSRPLDPWGAPPQVPQMPQQVDRDPWMPNVPNDAGLTADNTAESWDSWGMSSRSGQQDAVHDNHHEAYYTAGADQQTTHQVAYWDEQVNYDPHEEDAVDYWGDHVSGNSHQDIPATGASTFQIDGDDDDFDVQAMGGDFVGLPADLIDRSFEDIDFTIPSWKELDEQIMPRYFARGFDISRTTVMA